MKVFKDQILLVKDKTDKLISDFSTENWLEIPAVLNSNLNWQIGHIILANYLHGIASISGMNKKFSQAVNVPDYIKFYGPKSQPSDFLSEKPSTAELMVVYELTFSIIFKTIENIALTDLENDTAIPNPSVKTRYEALLWMSQHQSWHNGQIAILKRVLVY